MPVLPEFGDAPQRPLCVIRGGGDLATGVAWRLSRSGFPVVVTELAAPLAVRRSVCLSSAVDEGTVNIEGMVGRRASSFEQAAAAAARGEIGVFVSPDLPIPSGSTKQAVVIDARLAKRNLDTSRADADLVIALGPGFEAGQDCHAVIETKRGARLGRALWSGAAAADTGIPGIVEGRGSERVLRAPEEGQVRWNCCIGDRVTEDQILGSVGDGQVRAPFDGLIRGLIRNGQQVGVANKIGDVDPRLDVTYDEISDKALSIGGGVLEAVLAWQAGIT